MPDDFNIGEPSIPNIDRLSELEQKVNFSRAKRKIEMEGIGHKITIAILIIVVVVLGITGIVRMAHLVIPQSCHWLTAEELRNIDEFFIHGTVGALVVAFLRDKISIKHH